MIYYSSTDVFATTNANDHHSSKAPDGRLGNLLYIARPLTAVVCRSPFSREAMNPGVAPRGPVGLLLAAKGLTGPADEPQSTNPQGFLQIGHAKYCPPWISPSPRPYRRNIRYTLETLFKKVDK